MINEASVLVVGGGPAGVTAAVQARHMDATVTLLEADQVGGTNINRGPAPVRTMARSARLARDWTSWSVFGLEGPPPKPNLQAILANSDRVARYVFEKKHLADQLRRHGINLVEHLGPVRFTDPHTLTSGDGRSWRADHIILAVGGHAGRLPIPGNELALTYSDIRTLKALPAAAAVVGAADTGCQIASILADLGSQVSLFEAGPTVVPHADLSISTELDRAFQRKGIQTHTNTAVTSLRPLEDRIIVEHATSAVTAETIVDAVFFAVGWPPNTEQLDLDVAGISVERRGISADAYLRTEVDHIFAAGDVNGRSMLVQVARLEGRIAAQNALKGPTRQVSYDIVPTASFTDPEYGGVGLTETEAARQHEIVVGLARYDDLLRPVADGHQEGFCKLIADRQQKTILGGHVLGEYSAEIIQVIVACMTAGMNIDQVAELPFAFPTFTEGISMAAQKICSKLGIGDFPPVWSYLGPDE
ncbi:MAG TPA: NAD(P)/FAD-dependent oxidoreductase [Acidimicrobiales bacterium]|jgi:pyruvate/2-oxoglutarate dehydrogenase complex dihydrolipoamide dehydrogenase (E3) component